LQLATAKEMREVVSWFLIGALGRRKGFDRESRITGTVINSSISEICCNFYHDLTSVLVHDSTSSDRHNGIM
jgi:hypothetical protein